jgi:hypothetical protein
MENVLLDDSDDAGMITHAWLPPHVENMASGPIRRGDQA